MKKYILLLVLLGFTVNANAQLQNRLSALGPDSVGVLYGNPTGTTPFWNIFTALAVSVDSIMSSVQRLSYQSGNYSTLSAGVTAAAADTVSLVVSQRYAITTSTTLSGLTAIIATRKARFSITSGDTLFINVPLVAGNYQIFEGAGEVVIDSGMVNNVIPQWFGVKGDGGTNDTANFEKAINAASLSGINLLSPYAHYVVDSLLIDGFSDNQIELNGIYENSTNTTEIHLKRLKQFTLKGRWRTNILKVEDIWYSRVENGEVDSMIVVSGNVSWGQFWSTFRDILIVGSELTIDVGTHAANQNLFENIRADGLLIKESTANSKECHANIFENCDFTNGFIRNTTSKNQRNLLLSCYGENVSGGRIIEGNFDVIGSNFDITGSQNYEHTIHNWYIMNTVQIARNVDYVPVSSINLFRDGDFSYINIDSSLSTGLSKAGGTGHAWVTDTTTTNIRQRVLKISASATQTFRSLNIDVEAISDFTTFTIHFKGYVKAVEMYKNDADTLSHTITPSTSAADTSKWRVLSQAVESVPGETARMRVYVTTSSEASDHSYRLGYISVSPTRVGSPFQVPIHDTMRMFEPAGPRNGEFYFNADTLFVYSVDSTAWFFEIMTKE